MLSPSSVGGASQNYYKRAIFLHSYMTCKLSLQYTLGIYQFIVLDLPLVISKPTNANDYPYNTYVKSKSMKSYALGEGLDWRQYTNIDTLLANIC